MINDIIEVFEEFMMPRLSIDKFKTEGRNALVEKIIPFVNNEKPIDFVMLGFPFKSTNDRDKVFGRMPDLGEELTMRNMDRFNQKISSVYKPGVNINIASDGLIFNQLLGVEEREVYEYKERSENLIKSAPVHILDLNNFYSGANVSTKREKLMSQFGVTEEVLTARISLNPDTNMLYRGMSIFMEEEIAPREFVSGNQRHKTAKKLAKEMMMVNEAYSSLVSNEFKNSVRISMHQSVNSGNKYSFQLIEGVPENINHSPWHCVMVMGSEGPETMHKRDAYKHNFDIVTKDNQPYFFIKNN